MNWILKKFEALTPAELYAILRLRNEVFVVEQDCVYQDADDKDQASLHLAGWEEGELAAYCRIIPPGIAYEECSIGRVVCSQRHRNTGKGRELMNQAIAMSLDLFPVSPIRIGAQSYLEKFYTTLGFSRCSDEYLEDGIPHIQMLLVK